MNKTVDARGLSCPQPVLMTMDEIGKVDKGEIVVLRGGTFWESWIKVVILGWKPPIEISISDQEAIDIPQRDKEASAYFITAIVSEQ